MRKLKYNYEELKQLRSNSLNWEQIGEKYGVSKEAIRSAYRRFEEKIKEHEVLANCLNCNKGLTNANHKFCNQKCQQEYLYNEFITKWKKGLNNGIVGKYGISRHIRKYLFKKYNNKCSKCGWGEINPFTKTIPLEIEHIDGNYANNLESNLILLCPNCHSLTSTYKGANRGRGRKERSKYC